MTGNVFVSVIMPVRNEASFIAQSLSAVLQQDYPPEWLEILVVDGQSSDRTLDIIKTLPGAERVRIIENPRRIQAAGMNAGIRQARGEFIVRVDGHTLIAPDYIRQCVTCLKRTGAHNVGGPIKPVGLTAMGKAIACATQSRFAVPSVFRISASSQYTDTVYLGAWPRQVLEDLVGFDEHLSANEDYELNYRIRKAGGHIYLSQAIHSLYFGRQSLPMLARQYFHYGQSKIGTLLKFPASLQSRHLVAPLFVGALIFGIVLASLFPPVWILWLLMVAVYLATTLASSIQAARRAADVALWRVPLVFMTIHLAWGIGFWAGLLGSLASAHRRSTAAPLRSLRRKRYKDEEEVHAS